MLNVNFFTFNAFEENTYVISNEDKQCWIVDPGMYDAREKDQMVAFITANQLKPEAIINTHGHIDHILGASFLMEKYGIPFQLHQQETEVLRMAAGSAAIFGFDFTTAPKPTSFIIAGQPLMLGSDAVEVFHTPGHSPGSLSFYYPHGGWVIAGDVLFAGSIGRTDLPGGNFETLIHSIRTSLFSLPGTTTVFAGHGPETTIEQEKKHNAFLQ